ncbi:MAG: hypothetical protein MUP13_03800 [Thermoanaerobaculales bacterium]|nr:hypothetical protein [Thermoanaerobaculales bacterium]
MRKRFTLQLVVLLLSVCAAAPLVAGDDMRSEQVRFDIGTSDTSIEGTVTGYETVDYLIAAHAGQTMTVSEETYEVPEAVVFGD